MILYTFFRLDQIIPDSSMKKVNTFLHATHEFQKK